MVGVLGAGAAAGIVLVLVELVRRPEYQRTAVAFVATAGPAPILLGLVLGTFAAARLAPADRVLGREVHLRVVGVGAVGHQTRSLMRAGRDCVVAALTMVVVADALAAAVLPATEVSARVVPWPFTQAAPVLADLAIAGAAVAAGWLVSALVHLGSAVGMGRVVAGALAPLVPVLAAMVMRPVEDILSPDSWSWRFPGTVLSVAGAPLALTGSALGIAALAVGAARWRTR